MAQRDISAEKQNNKAVQNFSNAYTRHMFLYLLYSNCYFFFTIKKYKPLEMLSFNASDELRESSFLSNR